MAYAGAVFWKFERAVILCVASAAIAIATALVCVFALRLAHAAPGEAVFTGVAVEYALAWAVPAAVVAYPFLLWSLLRADLLRSLPLVAAVAVVVTPLAMLGFAMHGLWLGCLFSLAAMWFCRRRFRWEPPAA